MIKSTYVKSKKQYKVSFQLTEDQVGGKRDVRVLGNFNDWSWDDGLQMKATKQVYKASTELPAGNYSFRYLIDGHHWVNDESADTYSDSGHGSTNCVFSLEEVADAPKKSSKKTEKIESAEGAPATKPVVTPAKKKAPAKKTTTKAKTTKSRGKAKAKKDDLKKIEGIGPKIAGLLNDAGITSFAELSKASEKQLADVLQEAGARFRLAKHDTWQKQAKLAADGKMDELKKLQDKMN